MFRFFVTIASAIAATVCTAQARTAVYCDGTDLMNQRGMVLAYFTFESQCQEAIRTMRGNWLCIDGRGANYDLIDTDGVRHHGFTFKSECHKALADLEQNEGVACMPMNGGASDIALRDVYYARILHLFTFTSECSKALTQLNDGGMFCAPTRNSREYQLKDYTGRILREFTFESECQRMRDKILRGGTDQSTGDRP